MRKESKFIISCILLCALMSTAAYGQTTFVKRNTTTAENPKPKQSKPVQLTKEQYFERAERQFNSEQALADYRKAAEMGHSEAMYKVGQYYTDGKGGVTRNEFDAFNCFLRSAEAGWTGAYEEVASRYALGKGTSICFDNALLWYSKMALGNDAMIMKYCKNGDYYYNEKNYPEALKWYQIAAEKGDSKSQYIIGKMYFTGIGSGDNRIAKDEKKGEEWLRKASEKGNRDAKLYIDEKIFYVDLGLPSGTLWATRNVGANKPEEYGDYFAWGEVKGFKSGKTKFSEENYKWFIENNESKKVKKGSMVDVAPYIPTKYCDKDNKSILDLEDDAAYMNWSKEWHIPSKQQIEELLGNCTWTWSAYNGVNGFTVKGRNGKSIFLPSAGMANPQWYLVGADGFYWTNNSNSIFASRLSFRFYNNRNIIDVNLDNREYGMSIRPVRMKK